MPRSLSNIILDIVRDPAWPAVERAGGPLEAGAALCVALPGMGPIAVNAGALAYMWWRSRPRRVWRIGKDDAAQIAATGMSYLPPEPPPSWRGGAIIAESRDPKEPLVAGLHSIGSYLAPHHKTGRPYYWMLALECDSDGAHVWGVPADLGRLSETVAAAGALTDVPLMEADGWADWRAQRAYTPAEQLRILQAVQWIIALSLYASETGDWWRASHDGDGPPERNERGKVIRRGGSIQPLWTYRTLSLAPVSAGGGEPMAGRDGLALGPVIVSAHWRYDPRAARPVFVPPHASHRWKRGADN